MATINLPKDLNGNFLYPKSTAYIGATGEEITIDGFAFNFKDDCSMDDSPVSDIICYKEGGRRHERIPVVMVMATEPTEEEKRAHVRAFLLAELITGESL